MGHVRINLDIEARSSGYQLAPPMRKLLSEVMDEFCKEYQVAQTSAWSFFCQRGKTERLAELLRARGVAAESYDVEELPSWGIIIPNDDPVLVEYKLRYGNDSE